MDTANIVSHQSRATAVNRVRPLCKHGLISTLLIGEIQGLRDLVVEEEFHTVGVCG